MNIGQMKRKLHFAIDRITGKSEAIWEYNLLMAILVKAADEVDANSPIREYIHERLEVINEGPVVYFGGGKFTGTYNPFVGSQSTTRKKITLLRETMIMIAKAQTR